MKEASRISGVLALAALAVGIVSSGAGADAPGGHSAAAKRGKCDLTLQEARHLGATYVFVVKVRNTSCAKGKKVVKAYHECRRDNGGRDGRCQSRVRRYRCNEGERDTLPGVQYSAWVRCKKGAKRVTHQYQQNI